MTVAAVLWAIFGGFLGSLAVALIGWFFGLRKLNRRVDCLTNKVRDLDDQVTSANGWVSVLIDIADDEEFGKSVKRIMRRPD